MSKRDIENIKSLKGRVVEIKYSDYGGELGGITLCYADGHQVCVSAGSTSFDQYSSSPVIRVELVEN